MQGCLRSTRGMGCGRSLDLADHMFGDLVTTSLARDILEQFLADGTVTCEDNKPSDGKATSPALTAAYDDAVAYACNAPPDKSTPEPKTRYHWAWREFPTTPIDENKLAVFLNSIADSALSIARSIRKDDSLQAKNRFAAPVDEHHTIPLSYEPDGVDMRPDFVVLPLTPFGDDRERKVKEAYVNFTAMLLAGESKSNARDCLIQVRRYIRGIRRAQPWLRLAIGMSVGRDFVALSRGDNSGLERIEISLTDGRGCIEFIRIILGIVLADQEAFGHKPEMDIEERDVSLVIPELRSAAMPHTGSNITTSGAASAIPPTFSGRHSSRLRNPSSASSNLPSGNRPSATSSTDTTSDNTATGSKRGPNNEMSAGKQSKKRKRTFTLRAFVPVRVYGRQCTGFFTSASIRGRGTTVYVVVGADDGKMHSALKMSWPDVTRTEGQVAVVKKLSQHQVHANGVIPPKLFDSMDSMQASIRCILANEMQNFTVENRILTVTTSDLQRPVVYFWSPHDFVRGIKGALLGHEYLCEIGVLHCDISENNIVLSLCRDGVGALIDSGMATVGRPDMHRDFTPLLEESMEELVEELVESEYRPPAPLPASEEQYTAQRAGTTPYMSIGVLKGNPHTHFDDIESFLYVLVLFFLSYKGPLEAGRLSEARVQGFIQPVGMGRLPHVTTWPAMIEPWRSGTFWEISVYKSGLLSAEHRKDFIKDCLPHIRSRWEPVSRSTSIAVSKLVSNCWIMFSRHDRKVTHSQFIEVLDTWLKEYEGEENKYVYPFE
ncbi:hypothetical protein EDD15DRAFT_1641266 [Pisolithus albus]|nr:hypothetical protein EDD15DRAFT_1641266 [Pisolithus albus]